MGVKIRGVELWELMSAWKLLWLLIFGKVNTGWKVKPPEGRSWLPLYALKCDKHGIVQDTPHGVAKRLSCPKCLEEQEEK